MVTEKRCVLKRLIVMQSFHQGKQIPQQEIINSTGKALRTTCFPLAHLAILLPGCVRALFTVRKTSASLKGKDLSCLVPVPNEIILGRISKVNWIHCSVQDRRHLEIKLRCKIQSQRVKTFIHVEVEGSEECIFTGIRNWEVRVGSIIEEEKTSEFYGKRYGWDKQIRRLRT